MHVDVPWDCTIPYRTYGQFAKHFSMAGLPSRKHCHLSQWTEMPLKQKVLWQDATLIVYFDFITCIHSFNHNTFIRRHSLKLLSISSSLACSVGKTSLWGRAENRTRPALQQADALPTEPRRTLKLILSNILFFVCYQDGPEKFYRTAQRIRYRTTFDYQKKTFCQYDKNFTGVKKGCLSFIIFFICRSVPLCTLQFPVDF